MEPITLIISGIISVIDLLETQAQAKQETLPEALVQKRTELREFLVAQAVDEGTDPTTETLPEEPTVDPVDPASTDG